MSKEPGNRREPIMCDQQSNDRRFGDVQREWVDLTTGQEVILATTVTIKDPTVKQTEKQPFENIFLNVWLFQPETKKAPLFTEHCIVISLLIIRHAAWTADRDQPVLQWLFPTIKVDDVSLPSLNLITQTITLKNTNITKKPTTTQSQSVKQVQHL